MGRSHMVRVSGSAKVLFRDGAFILALGVFSFVFDVTKGKSKKRV